MKVLCTSWNTIVGVGLVAILICAAFFVIPQGINAQTASKPAGTAAETKADRDCRIALQPFIKKQEDDFKKYIENTFANKSDTSVLIDIGTERFRRFRQELLKEAAKYQPLGGDIIQEKFLQQSVCRKLVNDSLDKAERVLRHFVAKNAQAKKTTKMILKMQDINRQLNGLQRQVGVLHGYYKVFNNKLPCFLEKCVK